MVNETDIRYAQKLRGYRLKLNLLQKQMAEKLGLTDQQEYSLYENGHRHFTDNIITQFSNAIGVSVEEFTDYNKVVTINNSPHSSANNNSSNNIHNDTFF